MKLPADVKKKWLKALRSGKYKQTKGTLCDGKGYCCLGVLEQVTEGRIEEDPYEEFGVATEPSVNFWQRIGAKVDTQYSCDVHDKQVAQLMKMNDGMKWYDTTKGKMVETRKRSFNKIADWIEKHVETI